MSSCHEFDVEPLVRSEKLAAVTQLRIKIVRYPKDFSLMEHAITNNPYAKSSSNWPKLDNLVV